MNNYLKAARLRTLPLSLSGIVLGSFLAYTYGVFSWNICLLALITTIGFQVISNFANDYGDGVKGTDNERLGEKRMVASGEITPKQMKNAIYVSVLITISVALFLIYISFGKENFGYSLLFFLLGIGSIVAAIKYTVGKNAYGYHGLGDVFVFLFFGWLSVLGSYFLYTKSLDYKLFLPASSIGLLSVAVLNLNNIRDWKNDIKAHKNTLVVLKGINFALNYHYALITISFLCAIIYQMLYYHSLWQFIFLIAYIPILRHLKFMSSFKNEPSKVDTQLKVVAISTFFFAILFGLSLLF